MSRRRFRAALSSLQSSNTMQRFVVLSFLIIACCSSLCRGGDSAENNNLQAPHSRDKRSIYLNAKAPILIAAYITLPISVAFPALKGRSARSGQQPQSSYNGTSVPYSYDDPLFRTQLQKIDLYMDYMGIADDMCRQRFLCEISSAPDAYEPLYGVFKKQLSTDFEVAKSYSNRFFRYRTAMSEGRRKSDGAVCRELYGSCPDAVPQMINMNVLRIMQFMTRKFRVQFADTIPN